MSDAQNDALEVLYERYCDGVMGPEERQHFLRLLQDPANRRRFAELAAFDVSMQEELQISGQAATNPGRSSGVTRSISSLPQRPAKASLKRRTASDNAWSIAAWAAAACVLIILGVALSGRRERGNEIVKKEPAPQQKAAPVVAPRYVPTTEIAVQRERALENFKAARERERALQERLQQLAAEKQAREELAKVQENINQAEQARILENRQKEAARAAELEREAVAEIEKVREAARAAKATVVATTKKDLTLGRVTFVEKGAQVFVIRGKERIALEFGTELFSGDKITTTSVSTLPASPRTEAAITVFSGAELEIAIGTELTLESLERIKLSRGLVFAEVDLGNAAGAAEKAYSLVLETPHATTTVLGTRFDLYCSSLETRLQMEEGEVAFGNARGSQNVKAGSSSTARTSSAPSEASAIKGSIWRGRKKLESQALQLLKKSGKLMINFGPEVAVNPAGTLNDSGEPFDAARGYGWNSPKVGPVLPNGQHIGMPPMREGRLVMGGNMNADPILQGFVCGGWVDHTETWTMPLPNGKYLVTVCVGDGTNQGPNHVRVEDKQVVDAEMTGTEYLIKRDVPIVVKDNELTVVIGGHRSQNKAKDESSDTALNYMIIKMNDE